MSDHGQEQSEAADQSEPSGQPQSLGEAFSQAGAKLRRRENGEVDVLHAVGGWRGVCEALLPGLLFLTVFLLTNQLYLSLLTAAAFALVFALIRLIQRGSLVQSISGFVGVLICAVVSLRSGQAADFYVPGLWINAGYGLGILLSILFRFPVLGFIYGFIRGESESWRKDRQRFRAYRAATWVLFGMFALRLAVQLPLYLADNVAMLGTARLLMGTPLYAAVLWLTWMMSRQAAGERQEDKPANLT